MDEKSRERSIYRVTITGSIVNFLLLVFKFIAGIVGHSAAMIADAVHSLSDFVTDIIVIVFVRISAKPADSSHGYGHGKFETLATAIIGAVLLAVDITESQNAEQLRREFSANVSHELKTPLQGIIGSAELLESGMVKRTDEARFLGHIRKEASRLVNLVEDIIRLSQLDEGVDLPKEEVDLLEMAEEVMGILESSGDQKNVSLSVSGAGFRVTGVRRLLYEIVYNLCDNAIKYNVPGGSVQIIVENQRLTVKDTGIGISKEHWDRVFERFYRVDKSHSKQSGGTGLGLSIVKHAAAYHNAQIHLESIPGKGTTITIQF